MHLIVTYVHYNPGASQEQISEFYSYDKTSVARDAKRLEDMGHICRKTGATDCRRYQLYLTEEGVDLFEVIVRQTMDLQNKSLRVFQRKSGKHYQHF